MEGLQGQADAMAVKQTRTYLALALAIILSFILTTAGEAQTTQVRYFPETGHTVQGPFLTFFENRGGLEIFGYPLTEQFNEGGLVVQYFQRVRMEWHPENPEPYKVQLGLLGDWLGHREPPLPSSQIPRNNPRCRYFPETGHAVCYAFLSYYDRKGGLDIFGYPISPLKIENGRIVQYFQRARMEWHPELPRDQKVQLGNLGEIWVERSDFAYKDQLRPVPPPRPSTAQTLPEVTEIRAAASVKYAITGRGGYQTVYVYVTDQRGEPLQGAEVSFIARYSSGPRAFDMPPTNRDGYTELTFPLGNPQPGYIIVIDVTVRYGGQVRQTQTSFLPWW